MQHSCALALNARLAHGLESVVELRGRPQSDSSSRLLAYYNNGSNNINHSSNSKNTSPTISPPGDHTEKKTEVDMEAWFMLWYSWSQL